MRGLPCHLPISRTLDMVGGGTRWAEANPQVAQLTNYPTLALAACIVGERNSNLFFPSFIILSIYIAGRVLMHSRLVLKSSFSHASRHDGSDVVRRDGRYCHHGFPKHPH